MNIKQVLVLCLLFAGIIALPVQSQGACGGMGTSGTVTSGTYTLTEDCTTTGKYDIRSEVTINGAGFSITGGSGRATFDVSTSGAILHLNDVTIMGSGSGTGASIDLYAFGILNARNVIFRDNPVRTVIYISGSDATLNLNNVQFLDNGSASGELATRGSALGIGSTGGSSRRHTVNINGATFIRNSGLAAVIRLNNDVGTLNIRGCIRASGNTDADGDPATLIIAGSNTTVNDNRKCPKKEKEATAAPTATTTPTAATCVGLPDSTGIVVRAAYGLASGIQCQSLDGGGIGIQALAENHIAAVDVWGYVVAGVEVCFPRAGRLIFLDAAMSPRAPAPMQSYVADGMTCGAIDSAGSLVLLPPE